MTAFTGSLGITKDVRSALETSCKAWPGHAWDPSEVLDWWEDGPVAAHPKCAECIAQMKARLTDKGCSEEQMVRALRKIGVSVSVRKPSEGRVTSEEDIIMLGGSYSDWLKTRKQEYQRPERKLGDSIEWVEILTDEMVQSNSDLADERESVIDQRAERIGAGEDRETVISSLPMPDGKVYMQKEEGL